MTIERAWASDDGSVLLYKVILGAETIGYLNNDGETSNIFGQGVDLDLKLSFLVDDHELMEVDLYPSGISLNVNIESKGRSYKVKVQDTILNLGASPKGIEQLVIATHFGECDVAGVQTKLEPIPEQQPMCLRNGSELVGLVQGWVLSCSAERA
jgi:hypothetical protein